MTFDEIMELMLARVPDDVDKREGGVIWHAVSPVAAMVAELWAYGDNIHNSTIPDNEMAAGSVLTRKCAEHGVNRYPATKAVRRGIFEAFNGQPANVGLGELFAAESITYAVVDRLRAGEYRLECTQPGIVGNGYFGPVLPLDSSHQLGTATLGDVLVPGEEEEPDEALRTRFYIEVNALPFGGNVDQYRKWVMDIPGVGNAKIFPTPNGQGGRVHIVVVGPDNGPLASDFLSDIQEILDPEPHGEGLGTAPIGHRVSVSTVEEVIVDVASSVLLKSGYSLASVVADAREALTSYLADLSFVDNVVRVAHVEAAILAAPGVRDIAGTTLNGSAANITLAQRFDCYEVPVIGSLSLTEG